jgi:hypothetical protein
VTLCNAGIVDRAVMARTLGEIAEQQARQGGDSASRSLVPRILADMLNVPVSPGLRVVDGGRSGEPRPDDA